MAGGDPGSSETSTIAHSDDVACVMVETADDVFFIGNSRNFEMDEEFFFTFLAYGHVSGVAVLENSCKCINYLL